MLLKVFLLRNVRFAKGNEKVLMMKSDTRTREDLASRGILPEVGEFTPDMVDPDTLDLSRQGIEKLGRATDECQLNVSTLILDENELQRLDNIHTYHCLEKVRQGSEAMRYEIPLKWQGYSMKMDWVDSDLEQAPRDVCS